MIDVPATAAADQNELSRSLRPRHVAMITIGGIIGAGLFVGSSVAIAAAGPAIIVSYALTGLLVLLIMRMLGEMAVDMPQVRSFTEFTRAALGNWAGFSVGWLYWYFWVVVIPVEAIAGAGIIQRWLPLPMWQIGTVLMLLMSCVNLMSARAYGEFEFWFSSIKVAAILSFIVVVGAHGGADDLDHHHPHSALLRRLDLCDREHGTLETRGPGSVTLYPRVGRNPLPLRERNHGSGHSHGGAVVPQFVFLCGLARAVRPRQPRRCAALVGADQPSSRAGARRAARQRGGIRRRDRRHSLAERRVCLPGERVRGHHRRDLSRHRGVAGAHATGARARRRTAADTADVAVPVAELPRDRGDAAGADRNGADARAPRRVLDQHHFDRRGVARLRGFPAWTSGCTLGGARYALTSAPGPRVGGAAPRGEAVRRVAFLQAGGRTGARRGAGCGE